MDAQGQMMAMLKQMQAQAAGQPRMVMYNVQVPQGVAPGQQFRINIGGKLLVQQR